MHTIHHILSSLYCICALIKVFISTETGLCLMPVYLSSLGCRLIEVMDFCLVHSCGLEQYLVHSRYSIKICGLNECVGGWTDGWVGGLWGGGWKDQESVQGHLALMVTAARGRQKPGNRPQPGSLSFPACKMGIQEQDPVKE